MAVPPRSSLLRLVGCLLAVGVMLSTVGLLTPAPGAAASAFRIVATPALPLVGETTMIRGAVRPGPRPVQLQRSTGSRWQIVKRARARADGSFAFTLVAAAIAQRYRVVAPAAWVRGKRQQARTSGVAVVTGVRGSASIDVDGAPTGQRTDGSATFDSSIYPAYATFRPTRPGWPVVVERLDAGRWVSVATGQQDATGAVAVPLPAVVDGAAYRARTSRDAATLTSASQVVRKRSPGPLNDDFAGVGLDTRNWGWRPDVMHGRRQCAAPAPDRVSVARGYATLSVKKNVEESQRRRAECPDGVWDNAAISTKFGSAGHMPKYGTFAARVAFQEDRGMHGAFWLQGPASQGGAEIDVVEHFGVKHRTPLMTKVHLGEQSASSPNLMSHLGKRRATDWNVYSLEWTPQQYKFRINGRVTWVTNQPRVSSAEQEIILSLLTSDYETGRMENPDSTVKVDWVRTWAP